MRVVCDNCGASYKIPDSKLTKEVNKATCRKCGHAIFIKRAGEEEARPAAPPPSPHGEERTLITSAADLERAVRSRAGSGYDEPADQRPTTVSLDNHGEATVPREPLAPAAFPPPNAFVPASPAFPPPPALARPAQADAPPPPAPRPAPHVPGPAISPSAQLAAFPPPAPARPAFAPAAAALPPADGTPSAPALGAFDPRTDLSMALVALLVTVLGVLVLALSSWFQSAVVTGLGAFLALFGTFVVALILVTGGRGTRAASLAISFLGGLVLSGGFGAIVGVGLFFLTPEPAAVPMAVVTPPVVPPVVPVAVVAPVEPPPAELVAVVAPVEPPPAEPVAVVAPVEPPPAAPVPAAPVKATPPAATSTSKPASTSTASNSKATSSKSSSTSTAAETPERITPKATSSTSSTSSSKTSSGSTSASTSGSSTKSSSSGSTASTASAAPSGVSPMVIDTMIKSNKGVKSCFVQQRNETGDLPRGVKVKLTIQPSGKVSSAGLPSGDLQGSSFDSCLSSAVKSIQFPSFDGDPVTVTYPFSI
jgi:predicted Zn finger-like uncharacterized protein